MIYFDNAATTRPDPEAVRAMLPYLEHSFGNPSALYRPAAEAKAALDKARDTIAATIGADSREIYFTSGGTESDNWALMMACEAAVQSHAARDGAETAGSDTKNRIDSSDGCKTCRDGSDGGRTQYGKETAQYHPHIITSSIEHHAVLRTAEYLEQHGAEVTYLPVDAEGHVNPEDVEKAIRPETVLVSVMTANNEIGTIEPVREIADIAHAHGALMHTDAVQAYGHIPVSVEDLSVDLLSTSAHKLNGPKGTGFLYIRNGTKIRALLHGGAQERGRRAGTENVPGIVGFAAAASIAAEHLEERMNYVTGLRDELIEGVLKAVPGARLMGDPVHRLPGNADFVIPGADTEMLLIRLDMMGICASGGSACSAGSVDPSHVLLSCGVPYEEAAGALRLTVGHENTLEEVRKTVDALKIIAGS